MAPTFYIHTIYEVVESVGNDRGLKNLRLMP